MALVNRSHYGLANSVWSSDLARASRVAEAMVAGNSWINAHNIFAHGIPYAGCHLSGMGGGVLGPDTLLDYLRPQSVVRPHVILTISSEQKYLTKGAGISLRRM